MIILLMNVQQVVDKKQKKKVGKDELNNGNFIGISERVIYAVQIYKKSQNEIKDNYEAIVRTWGLPFFFFHSKIGNSSQSLHTRAAGSKF